jgi:hypothetical protein
VVKDLGVPKVLKVLKGLEETKVHRDQEEL